jgi:hypothetical protein
MTWYLLVTDTMELKIPYTVLSQLCWYLGFQLTLIFLTILPPFVAYVNHQVSWWGRGGELVKTRVFTRGWCVLNSNLCLCGVLWICFLCWPPACCTPVLLKAFCLLLFISFYMYLFTGLILVILVLFKLKLHQDNNIYDYNHMGLYTWPYLLHNFFFSF